MAYSMTVAEAASALGVSCARIYQLVERGVLDAERFGRSWAIDTASVEARKEHPVSVGRPRAGGMDSNDFTTYVLMNRTHEVLEFQYSKDDAVFGDIQRIIDPARAPLGIVSARGSRASTKALRYWWAHRAIPGTREGLAERLRELGLSAPEQVPFGSLGLSLSDQYWVRPQGADLRWEDINYFQNDFDLGRGDSSWLSGVGLRSPDNTSEGELPKRWGVERGVRMLYKGAGPLGQEPYNEVVATALYRRLLPEGTYVPYEVRRTEEGPVSVCACCLSDSEEYIPALYVRQLLRQPNHRNDFCHIIECCAHLGVCDAETRLSQMIVCDDILGNFDRHLRNFGVVRDVETLECRMAPLFDTGSSLWCNTSTDALCKGSWKFATKPFYEDANRQLRLVGDYTWFDPARLEGFFEEARSILASGPGLTDRVEPIVEAMRWRLNRILLLLA